MDLDALIANARAEIAAPKTDDLEVVLGGAKVTLTFAKLQAEDWDLLIATHPERPGVKGDAQVGYNVTAVSRSYPGVKVDGKELSAEKWAEVFSVLDVPFRNQVGIAIWGLNIFGAMKNLRALGKASAGAK